MFFLVFHSASFIEILVHTGLRLAGFEIIPQILPNTCELAQVVEQEGGWSMWPCLRDDWNEAWKMNGFDFTLLFRGWVGALVVRALLWLAYIPLLGFISDQQNAREKKEMEESGDVDCKCTSGDAKLEDGNATQGVGTEAEKPFRSELLD